MQKNFTDSDGEAVEYDGSPLSWRVSTYGVVIENDSLLIIKNVGEKLYDVPGGGIEMDESIDEALLREGLEEAGAHLKKEKILHVYQDYFFKKNNGKFYHTIQLYYLASLTQPLQKPTDKETVMSKFVPFAELKNYPLPVAVISALQQLPEIAPFIS